MDEYSANFLPDSVFHDMFIYDGRLGQRLIRVMCVYSLCLNAGRMLWHFVAPALMRVWVFLRTKLPLEMCQQIIMDITWLDFYNMRFKMAAQAILDFCKAVLKQMARRQLVDWSTSSAVARLQLEDSSTLASTESVDVQLAQRSKSSSPFSMSSTGG